MVSPERLSAHWCDSLISTGMPFFAYHLMAFWFSLMASRSGRFDLPSSSLYHVSGTAPHAMLTVFFSMSPHLMRSLVPA